jgi:hypothetical protein
MSDIHVVLDDDDFHKYEKIIKNKNIFSYTIQNSKLTLMEKINKAVLPIVDDYKYFQFLGDDVVLRSSWETKFIEYLESVAFGMAYGNDMINGESLATHPCITSSMIKSVGFFGCPAVSHSFFDTYWHDITSYFGTNKYFSDVIMEHFHPCAKKYEEDELFNKVENSFYIDKEKYREYMDINFYSDLLKIYNISREGV